MKILYLMFCLIPVLAFNQEEEKEQVVEEFKQIIQNASNDTAVVRAYEEWSSLVKQSDLELHEEINLKIDSIATNYLSQQISDEERNFYINSKADALSNLGRFYSNRGDYSKGIEFLSESLAINEKINDQEGVAFNVGRIGYIYRILGEFDKSLEYYKREFEIQKNLGDKFGESNALNNIGNVFFDQEIDDSAQVYYEQALSLAYESGNKLVIVTSLINYANIDNVLGNKDEAIEGYKTCLSIQKEIDDLWGVTTSYINITDTYIDLENYKAAIEYGKKAVASAEQLEDPYMLMYSNNFLAEGYEKAGIYDEALATYKSFILMKDSIQSEENQKAVIRQQIEYEYETQAFTDSVKSAEQAKVQEASLAAEQAKNKQQKQQSYFLFAGLGITVLFGLFIFNRFRTTRKQKGIIEEQKLQVDAAFDQLEHRNKEILDSIKYAKRIQSAILPPNHKVAQHLKDAFILYKPKDIVAGDFYWLEEVNGTVLFAAADCTGHGVPGAMVSVVCNGALNRSVREFGLIEPGKILDKSRQIVLEEFGKSEEDVSDGMDVAFCALNGRKLSFSGAHNPLWIIRKGELIEIKGDKQPIGKFEKAAPFSTHDIELESGDSIYVFTDGYADQFGGDKGKKFKLKALRTLLMSVQNLSMQEQKNKIDQVFENWRGGLEQIDDVCMFGVRIN